MTDLGGGRGWLNDGPAQSLFRIDRALGHRMQITEAGRTWAQQNEHWLRYQRYGYPIALHPDTPSIHQKGAAIDTNEGQNHIDLLKSHGWKRTVYRNGKLVEPWHFEYFPESDQFRSGSGGSSTSSQELKNQQSWLNSARGEKLTVDGQYGPATAEAFKRYQTFLKAYGYTGAIDGKWGAGTQAAHQKFYNEVNSGKVAEDGQLGPATIKLLQRVLGVAQDGEWGKSTTTALQNRLIAIGHKIAADGDLGPATIRALQHVVVGPNKVDGQMGPETIRGLQHYLNTGGNFPPAKAPTPPAQPAPPAKLVVDGKLGADTVKALQKVLGVTQDGSWGSSTTKALQRKLNGLGNALVEDGDLGPATIKALQTYLMGNAKADGEIGPETVKSLQTYLNGGGTFPPKTTTPTPTTPAKLTVDGQWGAETTKALQTLLGVPVDGEMGPTTWKAFQKATGQTQDGSPGPKTYKAMQMNVGATVDGQLGPNTIKKLQEFLNAGTRFTVVVVPDGDPVVTYPKPSAATYPGASWWNHSPNSSPRRQGDKVQYFVIHHAADTRPVEEQRDRFMKANDRNVSPNWLIGKDGSVSEIVPPDKYRAWTSGAFDYNAVTVETQNTSGDPKWGISEDSHFAIAKLVAWASKRYGFPIDRKHVIGHREVPGAATACPGPSMDLDKIVKMALEMTAPVPGEPSEPETPTTPEMWKIEIPKDEAIAAGKAIDEAIGLLSEIRKLYP